MTQEKNFFIKRGTVAVVALAVMILWGSAFPFVQVCTEGFQVAANDIPSRLFLAGIRFFSAALIMTVLCLLQGKNMRIPCRCIRAYSQISKENLKQISKENLKQILVFVHAVVHNIFVVLFSCQVNYITQSKPPARLCLHELSGIMALSQRRGCHHGEITASA